MRPPETLEQLVARINAGAYLSPPNPTGALKGAGKKGRSKMKEVKLPKGKEFTFKSAAPQSKFDWDAWFSGKLVMIERSVFGHDGKVTEKRDYEAGTDEMPAKLKAAARRKYKVLQISRRDADGKKLEDAIILKARDMTPDERQAEDLRRAEEKAARKEKEAAEANGAPATEAPALPTS